MNQRQVIKANISMKDIEVLEGIFATLTPSGWVIPEWLVNLKQVRIQSPQRKEQK